MAALSVAWDLRADPLSHQAGDLARLRMPAEAGLREDQLAVQGDFEPSLGRGQQLDGADDRRPSS
jgi:hypothetical protein